MPSFRVAGLSFSATTFDIVGMDGGQPRFIAHAGIAEADAPLGTGPVAVLDMGPPLHGPSRPLLMRADAVGSAELSDDEVQKIRTFVDLHAGEHASLMQLNRGDVLRRAPEMYCIFPHAAPFCEEDGRYVRMRFSCAGFAFEAYRFARVTLLQPNSLPRVGIDDLRTAYPLQLQLLDDGRITPEALGLAGSGPWPVLLCGYLFHALNRAPASIREEPYVPAAGDPFFTR